MCCGGANVVDCCGGGRLHTYVRACKVVSDIGAYMRRSGGSTRL